MEERGAGRAAALKKKPLVVLCHGFPDSWYVWRHQMDALVERGCLVVAVEMRGYGESAACAPGEGSYWDASTSFHQGELVDDLECIPQAFGRDKIDVLVGHDFGGIVAWTAAARAGESLIRRLVVCNCPHPGCYEHYVRRAPMQALRSLYIAFFNVPYLPELVLADNDWEMIQRLHGPAVADDEVEVIKWTISRPGAITGALNYYRALLSDEQMDHGERVWPQGLPPTRERRCPIPTTVVWGLHDFALEIGAMATIEDWHSDVTIVRVPDAGHWVQRDAPDAVTAEIAKHIRADE